MNKNTTQKIGISFSPYGKTYGRYGENKFLKTKHLGFEGVLALKNRSRHRFE
jgi:hypothetical protein